RPSSSPGGAGERRLASSHSYSRPEAAQEGGNAEEGDADHGDLPHRVETAEVSQDHRHDVFAMRDRRQIDVILPDALQRRRLGERRPGDDEGEESTNRGDADTSPPRRLSR